MKYEHIVHETAENLLKNTPDAKAVMVIILSQKDGHTDSEFSSACTTSESLPIMARKAIMAGFAFSISKLVDFLMKNSIHGRN